MDFISSWVFTLTLEFFWKAIFVELIKSTTPVSNLAKQKPVGFKFNRPYIYRFYHLERYNQLHFKTRDFLNCLKFNFIQILGAAAGILQLKILTWKWLSHHHRIFKGRFLGQNNNTCEKSHLLGFYWHPNCCYISNILKKGHIWVNIWPCNTLFRTLRLMHINYIHFIFKWSKGNFCHRFPS